VKLPALIVAAGLALLVGGPSVSGGKTPPPPTTLLAFEWGSGLEQVDPITLRRRGQPLVTVNPSAYAYSPDGGRIVLHGEGHTELVDVHSLRKLGRLPRLDGWVERMLWADPDRIVALSRGAFATAVVLDPATLKVVSKQQFPGSVSAVAGSALMLAVLAGPQESRIGPSQLHVVGATGRARSVALSRIRSGWSVTTGTTEGRRVTPAVAIDPAGRRAVVIQPTGPAAEVDLVTMEVTYHDLQRVRSLAARLHDWLEPQAQAKQVFGPELSAHWVGENAVAVASWEHAGIGKRGREHRALVRAHGVFLVDTRKWTRRWLSETASGVEAVGDTALVYAGAFAAGRPFGADKGRPPRGLDAYGPDGRRRFRLFGSRVVGHAQGAGAYAYVRVSQKVYDVVDVRTGRVLRRARTANDLWLLPQND
jgi:hypothetical protein